MRIWAHSQVANSEEDLIGSCSMCKEIPLTTLSAILLEAIFTARKTNAAQQQCNAGNFPPFRRIFSGRTHARSRRRRRRPTRPSATCVATLTPSLEHLSLLPHYLQRRVRLAALKNAHAFTPTSWTTFAPVSASARPASDVHRLSGRVVSYDFQIRFITTHVM